MERGDEVIRCMKCMVFCIVCIFEEMVMMGVMGFVGVCWMKVFDVIEMELYLCVG